MSGNGFGETGGCAGKGVGQARAHAGTDREAALRRTLNHHGFHLVDDVESPPTNVGNVGVIPTRRVAPCAGDEEPRAAHTFPCLRGCIYTGCLGLACPLDTCWTGGATVSFAAKAREHKHISAGHYTPGAPCHSCAYVRDSAIQTPLYRSPEHATARPGQGSAEPDETNEADETGKAGEATGTAPVRGVCCGKGLWAHPISLSAFVLKRIPMCEQDAPERCPGYDPRAEPHPAVAEHLRRRRERARQKRAKRKPED